MIQPVREAAELAHEAGGLLHADAVQALGKIPLDINDLGADLMAISAHKIGGPMGVGALVLAQRSAAFPRRLALRRRPGAQPARRHRERGRDRRIWRCGRRGHERHRRARGSGSRRCAARLEQGLREIWPDTIIFGEKADRVPNTLQFAVPGIKAQTALIALDLEGVAVSAGSACSSGTMKFSEVIRRMGYDSRIAEGAVRVSMGWATTEADIDRFLQAWRKVSQPLLKGREIAA